MPKTSSPAGARGRRRPPRAPRAEDRYALRLRSAAARSSERRLLREPDDARVMAEVRVAQLRVAVEPERADDAALEGAHEEVGQEVRAGLLGQRLAHLVEGEHVVAGVAAQTRARPRPRSPRRARRRVPQSANATASAVVAAAEARELARDGRAIFSGRLCSAGGNGWTSIGQPRRSAIALTCSASAPQAITPTGGAGLPSPSAHAGKVSSSRKRSL